MGRVECLLLSSHDTMTVRLKFKAFKRRLRFRIAKQPDEVGWMFRYLNPRVRQGVMVDVGAHTGSSLVEFAAAGWQIFGFEPDGENRRRLQWLVEGASNVVVDPRAVSDQGGECRAFYRSPVSTGISSLLPFHPTHGEPTEVETIALGDYLAGTGIHAVDFLKIDTEGSDGAVLRGMDFERFKTRVVVCEFDDGKTMGVGSNTTALIDLLTEWGYAVLLSVWHPLADYGAGHQWARLTRRPSDLKPGQWGNLIAMRADDLEEFITSLPLALTAGLWDAPCCERGESC